MDRVASSVGSVSSVATIDSVVPCVFGAGSVSSVATIDSVVPCVFGAGSVSELPAMDISTVGVVTTSGAMERVVPACLFNNLWELSDLSCKW